jgi:hypothetical protein
MAVIWVQALQKTSVRRRTICASLISAVLCCATSLSAQESRTMEISGGISRLSTETDSTIVVLSSGSPPQYSASNSLTGWSASAAKNVYHNLLVVADVSNHHAGGFWVNNLYPTPPGCLGGPCGPDYYIPAVRTWAYLFGPRISLRIDNKNALFVEGLLGRVQRKSGNTSASGMGLGFGGGYDRRLFGPVGLRFQAELMPSRIQGRWIRDTRIGLGAVFRFGS